ncbi:hypothetical protein [Ideonella dechloratans]|uniref:hypothetical protein n=1 Tax=Ideonella dechloratans TaxID=36863 RepID=UPI0035B1072F
MKRFCSLSVAVLATAVLSACGGGSGSVAGSTTSYAVGAAWENLYLGGYSWALQGTTTWQPSGAAPTYYDTTASLRLKTMPDAEFKGNGIRGHVLNSLLTIAIPGYTPTTSTNDLYLDANLAYMGSVNEETGYCEIVSPAAHPVPASAYIGSSGVLEQFTMYENCNAGAAVLATGNMHWSVEQQAGQVFFCLNTNTFYADSSDSEKDCTAIDPWGTIGSTANVTQTSTSSAGLWSMSLTTP